MIFEILATCIHCNCFGEEVARPVLILSVLMHKSWLLQAPSFKIVSFTLASIGIGHTFRVIHVQMLQQFVNAAAGSF